MLFDPLDIQIPQGLGQPFAGGLDGGNLDIVFVDVLQDDRRAGMKIKLDH